MNYYFREHPLSSYLSNPAQQENDTLKCLLSLVVCLGLPVIQVHAAADAPMGVERVARPTTRNYISPAVPNNDTACWVQVDIGRSLPIDKVKLFPHIDWGWLGVNKTVGFPSRFKIEVSDEAEFKTASVIMDQTGADYANTEDAVILCPGNGTAGRYVRLSATPLSNQKLELMKVEVWSGGKNVAEGCPVADSFKGNLGVTNLTLKRRPQDDVVTDNPGNVIPADQWKPVAYKAEAPLGGVRLSEGLFKKAMQNNIAYLMSTFTTDEMVREFRTRAGKPNPEGMCEPDHFWDTKLAGQNAGRFLMGAGNTLRWIEDTALRKRMNDIVDVIDECRQPDGYIMAFPRDTIFGAERAGYTRAWVTHGLIEAGYAGNPKAFPLLREFYDWFNQCPYLPELLRRPNQSQQGTVANTRVYFTPIGKAEDIQVVQRYFQENDWLAQLARRDTNAIWHYPYDRPHCYLLTAIEPYLDLYRATGKRDYLEAAMGGWELYHDNWEHIGGSIAICEGGSYPPKSYIFRCTGELCGSVFMARLSQRLHLLNPDQEKFVGEIEKSIYNNALANQNGDKGIFYHTTKVGHKDDTACKIGTCCEGQGTRMIGSIPEYIYSIAADGLYIDLYAPSEITWQQNKQPLKVRMITGFPFDNNVTLRFSLATSVAAKVRVRVPAWSVKPMAILVNNTLEVTGVPGSYATLERTWKDGDSITFTLPAELRMTKYTGRETRETQPRYALEYGPILLAAVGAGADRPEASFACDSSSLLGRIKPVADQPLHFSIEGESNYSFIPYWEVASKQTFTCLPIITESQKPQSPNK
ncbi:MAG: beta-L-arabinofuranosidase domain-containing protein [Verrucomicrobiota bacterium]